MDYSYLRGAHVTMAYEGRTLLGEVIAVEYLDDNARRPSLRVRHFNGNPWPVTWVPITAVTVLERE